MVVIKEQEFNLAANCLWVQGRHQMLATMVFMGINRIVVMMSLSTYHSD